ncbi:hypothetical protein V2J09_019536 [Rumex salicifolius]
MSSPANDPRMPSAARPYRAPLVSPQDLPVDYSGFLAVLCGVVGVMFKYKLGSWLALIFCAQSLANMRNMENDLKQISMAMILANKGGWYMLGCEPHSHFMHESSFLCSVDHMVGLCILQDISNYCSSMSHRLFCCPLQHEGLSFKYR